MRVVHFLQGILAVLGNQKSTQAISDVDFERELMRNSQLRTSSPEQQQTSRRDALTTLIRRATLLRRILALSFFSMGSAVAAGSASWYLKLGIPTPGPVLAVASAFCFAWATLGRLGWAGQSWKGDTAIEQVDQTVFHILYWLGMYFATVAAL